MTMTIIIALSEYQTTIVWEVDYTCLFAVFIDYDK